MPPPEKPRPTKPPKKPKPKRKTGQEEVKKKKPVMPERDGGGGVPFLPQNKPLISCATTYYGLCPPPPSPPATLHLRSARLPTALIALSASLLAVSAVLLLALLVRWLVRRRRRRGQQEEEAAQDDEESVMMGMDAATAAAGGVVEEDVEEVDDGGVHHVWFIRTKGLDERAIAAIAAVVYDASRKHGAGVDGDGCAVCLAEFRDGETLRLLPRCGHAFHRGCIDPWLRAHVNCPLCRAPVVVQVTTGSTTTAAAPRPRGEEAAAPNLGGARAEEAEPRRVLPERAAVRRAASMMALPRRASPEDVSLHAPPASNSGREEDTTTGLAKIRRLLKLSEAVDMMAGIGIGAGRSVSFGAGTCQLRLPTRSGPSTAAGVNGEEIE